MRFINRILPTPGQAFGSLLRSPIKNFKNDQRGVTALEFAIIALPFFAILMAIIEAGLTFFASQVMDTGFREAARLIRTGQASVDFPSQNSFKTEMCSLMNQTTSLFNCANMLIDVRVLANFDAATTIGLPLNGGGNLDSSQLTYDTVCGSEIVLVRAFYEWPAYANILGSSMSNLADGNILLASTAAFRTEPFGGCP